MKQFEVKTVCILGRQPVLGLAELESLYGAGHVRPAGNCALLDIPTADINFERLGGTIKVGRLLAEINSVRWPDLSRYLIDNVPGHAEHLPKGKFTLGLSAYGLEISPKQIGSALLEIKTLIRQTGRPARIVPNKTAALNSAQVLHNKLTHKGAWELLLVKNGQRTLLVQTLFVQDIEAYAARDQARPARDARVGMLPPKLAQMIINLAAGRPETRIPEGWDQNDGLGRYVVLDPFCGSGVILQEALLMGYSAYGTDIDQRMVENSRRNLQWLVKNHPKIEGRVTLDTADATKYQWPGFSCVASEAFLGRPLNSLPAPDKLKKIIADTDIIITKFLKNLAAQLKPGRTVCLAVPAWRKPDGGLIRLPLLAKLTDMGYTHLSFKHVANRELIYFRENQIVARELLVLTKT